MSDTDVSNTTMSYEIGIEKKIQNFVETKTGEIVNTDFSDNNTIKIVPKAKHGSVALGILWMKVLQYPKNFPVSKYQYKRFGGANSTYNIKLKLPEVAIEVNLKIGSVQIKGSFVIEWFTRYFQEILDIYDGVISHPKQQSQIYSEDDMKKIKDDIQRRKDAGYDWPDVALKDDVIVNDVQDSIGVQTKINNVDVDTPVSGIKDSQLMSHEEIDKETASLTPGSIIEGPKLYKIWRSLLHVWCSNEHSTIYIATPRIDATRLIEICYFCLNHRHTMKIGAICIPMRFDGISLAEIKSAALKKFTPQEQTYIEYRIFTQFLYPLQNFEAKFLASLNDDGIVDILVTSGDFNKSGFSSHNKNMVVFNSVREEEFKTKYLNPIMDY
ncbi:hypothetical protein LOTGIDRAFT_167406 [Lottia gigantea]|uniref:Uncharacterized protein n=1 Tax=Lottia gigantea TaxID=225164 RepID=V3Z5W9_LOTGI|nr:hypothetical protein LOTGIDRAFT_167406 [Lottia gigantea]ESO86173.1 hypothetical protein LOTGIDRAFT_167406 [Lottia gigantea]